MTKSKFLLQLTLVFCSTVWRNWDFERLWKHQWTLSRQHLHQGEILTLSGQSWILTRLSLITPAKNPLPNSFKLHSFCTGTAETASNDRWFKSHFGVFLSLSTGRSKRWTFAIISANIWSATCTSRLVGLFTYLYSYWYLQPLLLLQTFISPSPVALYCHLDAVTIQFCLKIDVVRLSELHLQLNLHFSSAEKRMLRRLSTIWTIVGSTGCPFMLSCRQWQTSERPVAASMRWGKFEANSHQITQHCVAYWCRGGKIFVSVHLCEASNFGFLFHSYSLHAWVPIVSSSSSLVDYWFRGISFPHWVSPSEGLYTTGHF